LDGGENSQVSELLNYLKNIHFLVQLSDPDLQLLDVPPRFSVFATASLAQKTLPAIAVLFKHPFSEFCRPS
jgi:hypothetical protein